jgi:hypothetical protein
MDVVREASRGVRPALGAAPVLEVFELSDLLKIILRSAASTNALVTKRVARDARAVALVVRKLIVEDRWKSLISKGTAILEGQTGDVTSCAFSHDG